MVVDEKGLALLSQRLSTGELAVFVDKVAPFSSKRLIVKKGNSLSEGSALAEGTGWRMVCFRLQLTTTPEPLQVSSTKCHRPNWLI